MHRTDCIVSDLLHDEISREAREEVTAGVSEREEERDPLVPALRKFREITTVINCNQWQKGRNVACLRIQIVPNVSSPYFGGLYEFVRYLCPKMYF
jgi:hypothetical protein